MEQPPPDDGWYFAYGSNLARSRIAQRTGAAPPARPACLHHYRLTFNVRADDAVFANIVPCPQAIVWGTAYWLNRAMMSALDGYEGVAAGCYRRAVVAVATVDGENLMAETYVGGACFLGLVGRPSDAYLQLILGGAREHGLPEAYIQSVAACASGNQ